jgi:hypothetical protein
MIHHFCLSRICITHASRVRLHGHVKANDTEELRGQSEELCRAYKSFESYRDRYEPFSVWGFSLLNEDEFFGGPR